MDLALQAIETHYKKNRKDFLSKVNRSLGDYAEDAVQETYLRALNAVSKGYEIQNIEAWMRRILFTVTSDYRRFSNGGSLSLEITEGDVVDEHQYPAAVRNQIISDVSKIQNPVEREVLTLNLVYGYDRREISEIVDLSPRTVEFWLGKFKNRIKELYVSQ